MPPGLLTWFPIRFLVAFLLLLLQRRSQLAPLFMVRAAFPYRPDGRLSTFFTGAELPWQRLKRRWRRVALPASDSLR